MSDVVLEWIDGWEAAGLIDTPTADRLRAAEASAVGTSPDAAVSSRSGGASSFFGPPVSIVEAFSYLGAAFVLAAWGVLIIRLWTEASSPAREWIIVAGFAVAAPVFGALGMLLHGRSERLSRGAGVAFVLSVSYVVSGITLNADIFADGAITSVVGVTAGLIVAAAYRWYHPAVLTQIALLATITGLVQAALALINQQLDPANAILGGTFAARGIRGAAIASAAWLACALVIGLIALAEDRDPSPAAGRRAALSRFWAGVVAVGGVATAVMRTEFDDAGPHRVIEPWIADLIVIAIAAVLLERAFRRGSAAYVLAAALGVVVALTDFNATYFAPLSGNEIALLVEGLLLIAIALAAERISRRVGGEGRPPRPAPEPEAGTGPEATAG